MSRLSGTYTDVLPAVVPLGFGHPEPAESLIKTSGNALLFARGGHAWLLTCRHLVAPIEDDYPIKAVWRPGDTNYFLVLDHQKRRPIPDGSGLVLFHFSSAGAFSERFGPLPGLDRPGAESMKEGAPMSLVGFEAEDMRPERIYSLHPLPETRLEASFLDARMDIQPEDYPGVLRQQQLAELKTGQQPEMSGSLISFVTGDEYQPAGMVTGTGSLKLRRTQGGPVEEVPICTYTPLPRVAKLIDALLNP